MRRLVGIIGVLLALSASPALAQVWNFEIPPPIPAPFVPVGAAVKSATLTRVVIQLNAGQEYGRLRRGVVCEDSYPLNWTSRDADDPVKIYQPIFFQELKNAGFKSEGDPNNLFEERTASTNDLQVAVAIRDIRASFCERIPVFTGSNRVSGKLLFEAEWQVYSRVKGEIVARVPTRGGFETPEKGSPDGLAVIFAGAFAENVRQLLASEAFRSAVLDTAPSMGAANASASGARIALLGSASATKRPIGEAVGSVVAIFAGQAMGTGFLVSSDGYVITNHHVVDGSKYVKVRWSDGFETVGEVVRSHKQRDVALIKTDPHGRQPLALRRSGIPAGETVFAVGTPLDEKFQGTLTKGVVSANRVLDGFSFIQSDVAVDHGNSGGPLLDEKGAVVGLTQWGFQPDGVSHNLNFFIPIGDALDFLALAPSS